MMRQQDPSESTTDKLLSDLKTLANYYIDIPVEAGGIESSETDGIVHRLNIAEQKQYEFCLRQLESE